MLFHTFHADAFLPGKDSQRESDHICLDIVAEMLYNANTWKLSRHRDSVSVVASSRRKFACGAGVRRATALCWEARTEA